MDQTDIVGSAVRDRGVTTAAFDAVSDELAVVICHFNPCGYTAPVRNLRAVLRWLATQRLATYAVELRCGASLSYPPVLPSHQRVLHIDSVSSMFRKDNLWNVGMSLVPSSVPFVLFLDADTILTAPRWKDDLLRALTRYRFVHPFERVLWTDSNLVPFKTRPSAGFGHANNHKAPHLAHDFVSGFGMAVSQEFFQETAGFYNSPIGGGSLLLMSGITGLQSELEPILRRVSMPFRDHFNIWMRDVTAWAAGSFGYISGDAVHLWHGARQKRLYYERFERLIGFDPANDIVASGLGVHEWSGEALTSKEQMVRAVESYFLTREEDEFFSASDAEDVR